MDRVGQAIAAPRPTRVPQLIEAAVAGSTGPATIPVRLEFVRKTTYDQFSYPPEKVRYFIRTFVAVEVERFNGGG